MYELQQPTAALAWTSTQSVCVACLQDGSQSELLELKLPKRLLAEGEDQDLCKERDFRIEGGGFHSQSVVGILNVTANSQSEQRMICCSEKNNNTMSLWKLSSEDSDLITNVSSFHTSQTGKQGYTVKMAATENSSITSPQGRVLFGGVMSDICVADLEKGKVTQTLQVKGTESQSQISSLFCPSESCVLVSCSEHPHIHLLDTRLNTQTLTERPGNQSREAGCVWKSAYRETGVNKGLILSVSSAGEVRRYDMRDLMTPVSSYRLPIPHEKMTGPLNIQISPFQKSTFSVSGLDQHVHIFRLPDENMSMQNKDKTHSKESVNNLQGHSTGEGEGSKVELLFTHRGHVEESARLSQEVSVLNHLWHSERENMMISSANDGSLHSWQYTEKVT